MQRIVTRALPDGTTRTVKPFHISMEGHETAILCREEKDYDAAVKNLCVCARRKNVIVIIYTVVSNHFHACVLAASQSDAEDYGNEVKRIFSMWFSRWYGNAGVLQRIDVKAIPLESDSHVRNALAYIPRNALDNGCNVNEYEWTGFKAMFSDRKALDGIPVASLTKRDKEELMHTKDNLKDVKWTLDDNGYLDPRSWCDSQYLEQAFENDASYFLRTVGGLNSAEMHQTLIENPRERMTDGEFIKLAQNKCRIWFKTEIGELPVDLKKRLASFLYRTTRTTIPQLSRALELEREKVAEAIGKKAGPRKVPGQNGDGPGVVW